MRVFFSGRRSQQPVASSSSVNVEDAWNTLVLVNEWIKHVETKTGLTLAAAGVVGGVLFNLLKGAPARPVWALLPAAVCGLAVLVSGIFASLALWPRLNEKEAPTNTLYFHHIVRRYAGNRNDYVGALRELIRDREGLVGEIAEQVWANAHVAHKKYRWSGVALVCLFVAIAALMITSATALVA